MLGDIVRDEALEFDPSDVVVGVEHFDEVLDTLEDLLDRWDDGKIEVSADEVAQLRDFVEGARGEDDD